MLLPFAPNVNFAVHRRGINRRPDTRSSGFRLAADGLCNQESIKRHSVSRELLNRYPSVAPEWGARLSSLH